MKFKSTWILALVAVALGCYVYFVEIKKAAKDEEKKAAAEKIFDFDYMKIKAVELKNSHGEIKLEKDGDNWKLLSPVSDSADTSAVNGMLSSVSTEKFDDAIENEDPKNFGLDQPKMTGTFHFQDGGTKVLNVGIDAAIPGKIYIQRGGDSKILYTGTAVKYALDKEAKDLREKKIFRKNKDDISQIDLKVNTKNLKGHVELSKDGSDWILGGKEKSDTQVVTNFLNGLEGLTATDFPSEESEKASEIKKYNLTSPALDISVEDKDKKELAHIQISDKKDNVVYANVEGSPSIYKLFASATDNLMKGPEDFKNKSVPFSFKKDDVEDIYFKTTLPEIHLVKKSGNWELPLPDPAKTVNQGQVKTLLDKLAELKVAEYIKNEAPKGLNPPQGHVVLKDQKGNALLDFTWGSRTKTPRNYFAKSNLYKGVFAVEGSAVDVLPNQTLFDKKAQSPAKATSSPTPPASASSEEKPALPKAATDILPKVKGP